MPAILSVLFSRRMWILLFMGFSSGLPLHVTGSTLQARMVDQGVDLSVIGLYALVGLPYTLKFFWAPFLDRFVPPFLGRRRGWALLTQIALFGSIMALGSVDPSGAPLKVAGLALLVTFFSASQDIVLDAYRREVLSDEELGLGFSFFINGYRIGMLISGALALFLADHLSWSVVYQILAACMFVGMILSFIAPEPREMEGAPDTLREAVVEPFLEFYHRFGAKSSGWILGFIIFYKIGDTMASHMSIPFLLETGFSKSEIAAITKTFGLLATLLGGLMGGLLILRWKIVRSLWVFGFLQMGSTILFAGLAAYGYHRGGLALVIGVENLTSGMGTSAFAAYMASLCHKRYTATQFALLSSWMGVPRVIAAAPTGWLAAEMGWAMFFVFCTVVAVPGLWILQRRVPREFATVDG